MLNLMALYNLLVATFLFTSKFKSDTKMGVPPLMCKRNPIFGKNRISNLSLKTGYVQKKSDFWQKSDF